MTVKNIVQLKQKIIVSLIAVIFLIASHKRFLQEKVCFVKNRLKRDVFVRGRLRGVKSNGSQSHLTSYALPYYANAIKSLHSQHSAT